MDSETPQPTLTSEQLQSDLNTIRVALGDNAANEGPHRIIIAAANIVCGLLLLIVTPFILLGTSIPMMASNGQSGTGIPLIVGLVVSLFFVLLASPFFFAAWGLFKRRSWGGIAAVVAACLNLLNVPLGTAIGIYTFWALANGKIRT